MKKEYKVAFRSYMNLDDNIEETILNYFKLRVQYNKEAIEELIKVNNKARKEYKAEELFPIFNKKEQEITYEEIYELIDEAQKLVGEYKYSNNMLGSKDGFVLAKIVMPIGALGIITGETKEKIKYMLKAITSHNAIDIIDPYYNEHDIFSFLMELLKNCLEKFDINSKLINYIPIEEYDKRDYIKIIDLAEEKIQEVSSKDKLIYIEDEYFKDKIENKDAVEVLEEADYEKALEEINKFKYKVVSVYTRSKEIAYLALNEIYSENVYINTSIDNIEVVNEIYKNEVPQKEEIERVRLKNVENKTDASMYITKSIIYEVNEEIAKYFKDENKTDKLPETKETSTALIKVEKPKSILSKIKSMLAKILKKR